MTPLMAPGGLWVGADWPVWVRGHVASSAEPESRWTPALLLVWWADVTLSCVPAWGGGWLLGGLLLLPGSSSELQSHPKAPPTAPVSC